MPFLTFLSSSGLFVNLYTAVERLLMCYQDSSAATPTTVGSVSSPAASTPTAGAYSVASSASSQLAARCVLFHELCPALAAVMRDGMKPEVLTSFGRMPASVWRLVEAATRSGNTATSDLVMMLNAKFSAGDEEEQDERKFAGFVAGLLK